MAMESTVMLLLVGIAGGVIGSLGAVVTHLAYRAYQRSGSSVLKLFAAGFGLVTLGPLIGGVLQYVVGMQFVVGVLVQRVLIASGFGLLVYSLYARLPDIGGDMH